MYILKLSVDNEKELYHAFDPDETQLSDEVVSYLSDRMTERNLGEEVDLQIISPDPVDEDKFRNAVAKWVSDEQRLIRIERRKNLLQMIWRFGLGMLFIIISLMVQSKVSAVWFTVLSTIGAFSIWEAANIWIIENPKLRMRKRVMEKMSGYITIRFVAQSSEGGGC